MQPPYRQCSDQRSVVLVGASVRAAAESARRGGFYVTGIDLFGDTDCRRACHRFFQIPDDCDGQAKLILDACAGLPMLKVGGFSGNQSLLRSLSTVCSPLGPPESIRSQLNDPQVLNEIAAGAGLRFPTTLPINRATRLRDQPGDVRWLSKQSSSSGGLGVRWQIRGDSIPSQGFIQRWIPGRNYGATFLSDGKNVLMLGVCRSLWTSKTFTNQGRLPFVYAGSLGPISLSSSITTRLNQLGQATVDQLELSGLFNADVIVDPQGQVWLLEINARWSASTELMERELGDRFQTDQPPSLITQVVSGKSLSPQFVRTTPGDRIYLKRIIYATRECRFFIGDLANKIDSTQTLHDIPSDGTVIQRGEPILTLITSIDSQDRNALRSYRGVCRQIRNS